MVSLLTKLYYHLPIAQISIPNRPGRKPALESKSLAGVILADTDAKTIDKFTRSLVFDLSCHRQLIKRAEQPVCLGGSDRVVILAEGTMPLNVVRTERKGA